MITVLEIVIPFTTHYWGKYPNNITVIDYLVMRYCPTLLVTLAEMEVEYVNLGCGLLISSCHKHCLTSVHLEVFVQAAGSISHCGDQPSHRSSSRWLNDRVSRSGSATQSCSFHTQLRNHLSEDDCIPSLCYHSSCEYTE